MVGHVSFCVKTRCDPWAVGTRVVLLLRHGVIPGQLDARCFAFKTRCKSKKPAMPEKCRAAVWQPALLIKLHVFRLREVT